jgi:hypothetical protein
MLATLCENVGQYDSAGLKSKTLASKWSILSDQVAAYRALGSFVIDTIIPALKSADQNVGQSGKSILSAVALPSGGFYLTDTERETMPSGATLDRAIDAAKYVSAEWFDGVKVRALAATTDKQIPCAPAIGDLLALARILVGEIRPKATSNVLYAATRKSECLRRKSVTVTPGANVSADRPSWLPALDASTDDLTELAESYDLSDAIDDLLALGAAVAAALMLADRKVATK